MIAGTVSFGVDACRLPLLVMFGGGPALWLLLAPLLRKSRFRCDDPAERRRRAGVAAATVMALCGSWFLTVAALLCRAGPPCPEGWELNCSGTLGQSYMPLAVAVFLAAVAINAWDISRRARWRRVSR